MAHIALQLKEEGNQLFNLGDFAGAEDKYTLAISRDPSNAVLFTNRAFARLKLQRWDEVIDDSLKCVEITKHNGNTFKAFFYLAQAQLALHHPNEALISAQKAYEKVIDPRTNVSTASVGACTALVLKCKKTKFEARQRDIQQRRGDLLGDLEAALETKKRTNLQDIEAQLGAGRMKPIEADDRRQEVMIETQHKIDDLRTVFAVADPENHAKKEIPEWAIDTISFELMHDPIMTKNGHSYERATLMEHLKRSPTDPLTREPLTIGELRPNIALRKALDDFWEQAGSWAIDWS